jgi:hypothetical protein
MNGELTAAEPSQQIYGLMMAAKYEQSHAAGRGGSGKGQLVVNVNYHTPRLPALPPLRSRSCTSSSPSKKKGAASSPMTMPSDLQELPMIETLEAFFAWCKIDKGWITEGARLD